MPQPYPGSDLSPEQLVHALALALDSYSPSKSNSLVGLGPQKIFETERDLSKVLQSIRAIRNAHIPVNGLPPEVLSRVLEYRRCEQDLFAATHTCQYWRSALTSSPPLWTRLRLRCSRDVDRALTYLERSKSVTIDIDIVSRPRRQSEVLKHFTPHISRTKSFILRGTDTTSSFALCSPAPSLKQLEMRACGGPLRSVHDFLGRQAPLLHSANFDGIFPLLDFPFPLPNLTKFDLRLSKDAGTIHTSSLLQFLSVCPRLQKIAIDISCEILQDATSAQIISLESLMEFCYTCGDVNRFLPFLKLPRLKCLRASIYSEGGQGVKLADLLPYGGRALLAGATSMSCSSDKCHETVDFPGMEIGITITSMRLREGSHRIDWFSESSCIPLGEIEDLRVGGVRLVTDFSFNLFKGLTTLWLTTRYAQITEAVLGLLHQDQGVEIPCPSLREIKYEARGDPGPPIGPLLRVVRGRQRAGYQLELLRVVTLWRPSQDNLEELKGHVGELQICVLCNSRGGFNFVPV